MSASTEVAPTVASAASRRERALVPILIYIGLLVAVVSSLGAPLVPTIASDYGVTVGSAQWTLTIALLVGAVSAPIIGRLGDGPRRLHVLIATLAVMTTGSILAALPTGAFALLLVGRGMQGAGLSLLPLVMGIARDHLAGERARSVVATLSVTTVIGVGLGYPITGVIAERLDYRLAFWLAAALAFGALVLSAVVVPSSKHRHASQRFDFVGAVSLSLGLVALLLSISMGEDWGWGSVRIVGLTIGAVLVLAVWTWHQLRAPLPLIDLRLMRNPTVGTANLAGILAGVGMYMLTSMVIRFVQTPESTGYGLGASVLVASLVLVPLSVASYFSSKLATVLGRRFGPGYVVSLGMVGLTIALVFFVTDRDHLWEIFVVMGFAGLGVGCSFAVMPRMIISAVPPNETGSALALNQVLRQVGFSMGSALSATILTAHTTAGSPYPSSDGFTVGALVGIAICVLTAIVTIAAQLRQGPLLGRATPGGRDDRAVEQSADSAIAGVVAYEPDDRDADVEPDRRSCRESSHRD